MRDVVHDEARARVPEDLMVLVEGAEVHGEDGRVPVVRDVDLRVDEGFRVYGLGSGGLGERDGGYDEGRRGRARAGRGYQSELAPRGEKKRWTTDGWSPPAAHQVVRAEREASARDVPHRLDRGLREQRPAPRHPHRPPAVDGAHVLVKRGMGDEDEIDAVAIVVEVIDVLHLAADVQVDRPARGAALVVVVVHRDDGHDAMPACHERLSIDVRRGSDGEREGARRQTKEGWIEGKGRSGERQDLRCGQDGRATARRAAESFFNHAAGGRGPWGGMP